MIRDSIRLEAYRAAPRAAAAQGHGRELWPARHALLRHHHQRSALHELNPSRAPTVWDHAVLSVHRRIGVQERAAVLERGEERVGWRVLERRG